MGLKDKVSSSISALLSTPFDTRRGYTVPTTNTVKLSDGAVKLNNVVFMYSDMANSTSLAKNHPRETTAKVVRCYLSAVSRAMLNRGGEIRSFDGDRVMAAFMGTGAVDSAARAALEIKWLIDNVVQPRIYSKFSSIQTSGWEMKHGTGIDVGEALMVRGGVRDNNDLVGIGDPPNIAAKLSELRKYRTYITARMWDAMSFKTCYSEGKPMWSDERTVKLGERQVVIRSSDWGWVVS